MTLPHEGVDLSLFCGAIRLLENLYGPKGAGPETTRIASLLAELQHAYKSLPDEPKPRKAKKGTAKP